MIRSLISVLVFSVLTGCMDKPQTLEVVVPKSVSTKVVEQQKDNELYLRIGSDGSIQYRMGNESDSASQVMQNPTVDDLKSMLSAIKEKVEKKGKGFSLKLESDSGTGNVHFKKVIEAMKSLEIYKFSMITAPANGESK